MTGMYEFLRPYSSRLHDFRYCKRTNKEVTLSIDIGPRPQNVFSLVYITLKCIKADKDNPQTILI